MAAMTGLILRLAMFRGLNSNLAEICRIHVAGCLRCHAGVATQERDFQTLRPQQRIRRAQPDVRAIWIPGIPGIGVWGAHVTWLIWYLAAASGESGEGPFRSKAAWISWWPSMMEVSPPGLFKIPRESPHFFFAPPRLRHQAVVVWIGMACAHGEHEATLKILLRPIWNCSCCFMMFYLGWVLVEYELLKWGAPRNTKYQSAPLLVRCQLCWPVIWRFHAFWTTNAQRRTQTQRDRQATKWSNWGWCPPISGDGYGLWRPHKSLVDMIWALQDPINHRHSDIVAIALVVWNGAWNLSDNVDAPENASAVAAKQWKDTTNLTHIQT